MWGGDFQPPVLDEGSATLSPAFVPLKLCPHSNSQKSQPSQTLKLSQPQSAAVVTTPAVPRGHEGGGCVPPFLRRVARLCTLHPGALFGNTFHKLLFFCTNA